MIYSKQFHIRFYFAIAFISLLNLQIKAQNGVKKCGSTHYSMVYNPSEIDSFNELPSFIQKSLISHLKDKLGHEFYKKLNFESGLLIDYKELIRLDPQVINYKWKVPKYDLSFYINEKKSGINYCCSRIVLDSLGSVITDIQFPSFKKNNLNTNFIPVDTIFLTAKKMGYSIKNYELGFSKNHIVFIFSNTNVNKKVSYIEVSAHTAALLKKYKLSGIRDF